MIMILLNTWTGSLFYAVLYLQGRRERGRGGGGFFLVKLETINFLHVNKMWDFILFIEQDLSDKK